MRTSNHSGEQGRKINYTAEASSLWERLAVAKEAFFL